MEEKVNSKFVLLLKSPKDSSDGGDPYEKVLVSNGYTPVSLPVLEFQYKNIEEYVSLLSDVSNYSAVIFTSQQAVKATQIAAKNLTEQQFESLRKALPCYVVGKATGSAVEKLGLKTKGEEAGNADRLSEIIIQDFTKDQKPLLYPCGNIRRDLLPKKLKDKDIEYKEITVYETVTREDVCTEIQELVQKQGLPVYVVYFSPSGVKATLNLFEEDWFKKDLVRVIAVGPSTENALTQHNIDVFDVMVTPEPDSLLQILRRSDNEFISEELVTS